VLHGIRGAKGFDFDTQLVVRLFWAGVVPLNLPTQVRYPSKKEGGVSHFQYVRDNWLLARVHAGLLLRACGRVPDLLDMRRRSSPADRATDFSPAQQ
jgi:hypothetical protein